MINQSDNQYRRVSYLCVGCKTRRSVIVDQNLHLDREELKINGLAPYIDIHTDYDGKMQEEHGIKLFIDSNFHARSNDLLSTGKPKGKGIPGLPSPSMSIQSKKLMYPSISWNSLELSSKQHNLGFFVINTEPTTDQIDSDIIEMSSKLGTVTANINFRQSKLSESELENSRKWIRVLLDWIETTAALNSKLVPSIIRYIDTHNEGGPSIVDQLAIPILLDNSAKIRLKEDKDILEDIIGTTIQNPFNVGVFYPNQSVDYESFFLIKDKLSKKRFTRMSKITSGIMTESSNTEKTSDAFILFFFQLFDNDSIEYQVAQLL